MQDNKPRPHSSSELRSALADRMQDDVSTYGKILEILSRVDRERYLLECEIHSLAHQVRAKSEELRVVRETLRDLRADEPASSGLWDRLRR